MAGLTGSGGILDWQRGVEDAEPFGVNFGVHATSRVTLSSLIAWGHIDMR